MSLMREGCALRSLSARSLQIYRGRFHKFLLLQTFFLVSKHMYDRLAMGELNSVCDAGPTGIFSCRADRNNPVCKQDLLSIVSHCL